MRLLIHLLRLGRTSASALAAADHQQPRSLTRVLAEFERDGLISRARSEQDRRLALLDITQAGRDALGADMSWGNAWLAAALDDLTDTEQQVLLLAGRLMNGLANAASQRTRASCLAADHCLSRRRSRRDLGDATEAVARQDGHTR